MRRTGIAIIVAAAVVLMLGLIRAGNPRAARFEARQAAIAQGASGGASLARLIIKEWDVPTSNSHPHDPAVAPDGALWYTGQMSNTLGRVDPPTGKIREYRLRTPDSGAHSRFRSKGNAVVHRAAWKLRGAA